MNPEIRSFVLRLGLFAAPNALLLIALIAGFFRTAPADRYFEIIPTKRERLRTVPPPRLLLVGGSSAAFGLDSRTLEQRLGIGVVNLGLHGSLGPRRFLTEARRGLKSGDVVALSVEYEFFCRDGRGGEFWEAIRVDPASLRTLSVNEVAWMMDNSYQFLGSQLRRTLLFLPGAAPEGKVDEPYLRHCFNPYGDIDGRFRTKQRTAQFTADLAERPLSAIDRRRTKDLIGQLNAFACEGERLGARVFVAWPAVPETFYRANRAVIEGIGDAVATHFIGGVLRRPADAVLPDAAFFDTRYHLLDEASIANARALGEALAKQIGSR